MHIQEEEILGSSEEHKSFSTEDILALAVNAAELEQSSDSVESKLQDSLVLMNPNKADASAKVVDISGSSIVYPNEASGVRQTQTVQFKHKENGENKASATLYEEHSNLFERLMEEAERTSSSREIQAYTLINEEAVIKMEQDTTSNVPEPNEQNLGR